jgi:hypothetical protein
MCSQNRVVGNYLKERSLKHFKFYVKGLSDRESDVLLRDLAESVDKDANK